MRYFISTGTWRIMYLGNIAEIVCPNGHLGLTNQEFGAGLRRCLLCKETLPENIATQYKLMTT